ncbi:MAG: AAA family ATPase [Salinispira sp.]
MIVTQRTKTKIIPIAGGKGGVGKTEFCANLGVHLGQLGYKVILIDLDLGGSNLHSTLGLKNKSVGVGNFLSDRNLNFNNLISQTHYSNVGFIPGDVLVAGTPNLGFAQKQSLIHNIEKLDADYVLIDLGSGSSNNVVDFFLISNSGILLTSPHIGSILNTYSFLKNTIFRFLIRAFSGESDVEKYLRESIKERRPGNPVTIANVFAGIEEMDSAFAGKARRYVDLVRPLVVLNMVRTSDDFDILERLRDLTGNNLDVKLETLGMIIHDDSIAASHRSKIPMVEIVPESLFSIEVDRITQKIVQSPNFPELALATDLYPDSYALMHIESKPDLEQLYQQRTAPERQAQADATEFLEVLSTQKKQIHELRNTVRMLSMKNLPT